MRLTPWKSRNSHYGVSKGAVTAMVRALAVELAGHKIRFNSILPGWIATDMTEKSTPSSPRC
jgi:NAD(P)-dependent dehydrogenase (short-subunit alcohol dehydrogenase family)